GIIPYIEYYTEPGDVVMDPFSGSGMTGVAAQIMANRDPRSSREVILNDLGPAACHITYNHTHAVDPKAVRAAFEGVKLKLNDELNAAYISWHVVSGETAVKGMTLAALEAAVGDSLSRPKRESY